ncbi:substrate-binding domain-containing protein [Thermatribacter velox]|jgi:ribose transport system substrate-binding protein|uniref:Substrate-binding domain-containing protein n=1 Tax=Thermatribacter velox TaxID=3039681 RepID=A0ABZ2YC02_9BACT
MVKNVGKVLWLVFLCVLVGTLISAAWAQEKTIAMLTPYLASVTTNQMIKAFEEEAKKKGWNVITIDTKGDFAALASRMEDMIARKVDAIVLGMADPVQLKDQIKKANEANIPVLGGDAGWIPGVACNVTSNNYVMSAMMTTYLFNAIGLEGNIVVFTHRPHHGVRKRTRILEAILEENPNIKVITEHHVQVPGPIEDARKAMESILIANPQPGSIKAVWAAWDEPAIGATQAIIAAGREKEIVVAGIDGTSQAIELIKKGSPLIATVSQDFVAMAKILVEQLERIFAGQAPTSIEIYAPSELITRESLE